MDPLTTYKGHSSVVGDVAWHNLQESIFASVGDDRMMLVCVQSWRKVARLLLMPSFSARSWDTREKSNSPKQRVENAHGAEINAVVFSPANDFILCTGSSDKVRRDGEREVGCASH